MANYNPERMELAGRDEVARAIYTEVQNGQGTENGGVYLDVSHVDDKVIEERLPKMLSQFLQVGVDIRKEPMEVHPTMHHIMGGVHINARGETKIKGLFAAGEVVGGIHGGNRLGGNAVAECQVFGRRAALSALKFSQQSRYAPAPNKAEIAKEIDRIYGYLLHRSGAIRPHDLAQTLRETMWHKVGIARNEKDLLQAREELASLRSHDKNLTCDSSNLAHNQDLLDCLEVTNMLPVAQAIVEASLWRTESRGAHYRTDFPEQDVKQGQYNSLIRLQDDGITVCDKIPLITQEDQV
jgi:fumarate reductase (CoM/CoB) subunit A